MIEPIGRTAEELVPELLATTDRLNNILVAETTLMSRPDPGDPSVFTAEKSKLVVRYENLMRALALLPPAAVAAVPEAAVLGDVVARVTRLAQANARAIELHIKATRQVLDLVARAARKATRPTFTYGTERHGYGVRSAQNAAVAVNRVL